MCILQECTHWNWTKKKIETKVTSKFHILFLIFSYCVRKFLPFIFFKSFSEIFFLHSVSLSLSLFHLRSLVSHFLSHPHISGKQRLFYLRYTFFLFLVFVWIESWRCGWQKKNETSVNVYIRFGKRALFFIFRLPFALSVFLRKKGSTMKICIVVYHSLLLFWECEREAEKQRKSSCCILWFTHEDFSFGDIYM